MNWWLVFLIATGLALAQFISWHPPHAYLAAAYPLNATHFVEYYGATTLYYIQDGIEFRGDGREAQAALTYISQVCRYVSVEPLNITPIEGGVLVRSNIYCSHDGRVWLWLKWLPLRLAAYVGLVNLANATGNFTTPVGNFSEMAPEGWYLHLSTKTVVKVPPGNTSLYVEYDRLVRTLDEIKAELGRALANSTALGNLLQQLSDKVKTLSDEKTKLEELLKQREQLITALNAKIQAQNNEIEDLKKRLSDILSKKDALLKRMEELNRTHALQVSQLQSQLAQLQSQLSAKEEGNGTGWLIPMLLIALGGVIGAVVYVRRRQSE
ncbi:hypothetical protein [Pyrobaculum ferrireducens]|uniref:Uncharacterized protein n=1 Tax=Pyrobaculum ferrireducens TaxID=1104324 RepID=G7VCT9_9CREN|nr:hypothetical protein [Pyrobaculum ferrireducens]AET32628.1 hypothetical protein P186_1197 [Pyrobaculum ferrireducens]